MACKKMCVGFFACLLLYDIKNCGKFQHENIVLCKNKLICFGMVNINDLHDYSVLCE